MKLASREDVITIIQVASWLFFLFAFWTIQSDNEAISYVFLALWAFAILYSINERIQCRLGRRPNMIVFPTQNDDSGKFMFIAFGIVAVALSFIGLFVFHIRVVYGAMGIAAGVIIAFMGYLLSPQGWMRINQNTLSVYHNDNPVDITQLKTVVIKNDIISFLDIRDEAQNSTLLNLDIATAERIKDFFSKKLTGYDVLISINITQNAQPRTV